VALLGASPVTELGPWSTYRHLSQQVDLEPLSPEFTRALHALIYDIKAKGGNDPELAPRFEALLAQLRSEVVVLACTELPLVRVRASTKRLIDPTDLVALDLARRARHLQSQAAPA
jgi:aspartate racemase